MDLDTVRLFRPITKWNAVVHDARRIPELTRTAFRKALSGRNGPVHLDIPQDVLSMECEFADDEFLVKPANYRPMSTSRAAPEDLRAAAQMLREAQRPLIVAGGGVVASGAEDSLRRLAQVLHAPVVPTQMALGAIPTDSANFIGQGGIIGGEAIPGAFSQADLVVAIGCRFSSWMWDDLGPLVRRHHRLININIDPDALGATAVHELALLADADAALKDILRELDLNPAANADPQWLSRLRQQRVAYEDRIIEMNGGRGEEMHPAALARRIAAVLPENALAVYDGGHTTFWSNDLTPVRSTRTRFHDPGMAQLGFGLPYAIALQLQHPDKPVFNITGDGAFGFTLQELDTARRHGLPVINIIHNNASWGHNPRRPKGAI